MTQGFEENGRSRTFNQKAFVAGNVKLRYEGAITSQGVCKALVIQWLAAAGNIDKAKFMSTKGDPDIRELKIGMRVCEDMEMDRADTLRRYGLRVDDEFEHRDISSFKASYSLAQFLSEPLRGYY